MGRATVVESKGGGHYVIDVDYGTEIIAARSAEIQARIDEKQSRLDEMDTEVESAETEVTAKELALDQAIADYQSSIVPGEPLDTSGIKAASADLIKANGALRILLSEQSVLKTAITSLQADLSELENVRTQETREAWCADYTVSATGEVATLEIPGEPQSIIIVPGARPPTPDDGRLIARGAQEGHQVYYNAAILPGWQKWMPTFRSGVITRINGDFCDVTLDPAESSAQALDVNQELNLVDIPIEYMECNAQAFDVGDHVVVNMKGEPNVVGFVERPKVCCFWLNDGELPEAGQASTGGATGTHGFYQDTFNHYYEQRLKGHTEYLRWARGPGTGNKSSWPAQPLPDYWQYDSGENALAISYRATHSDPVPSATITALDADAKYASSYLITGQRPEQLLSFSGGGSARPGGVGVGGGLAFQTAPKISGQVIVPVKLDVSIFVTNGLSEPSATLRVWLYLENDAGESARTAFSLSVSLDGVSGTLPASNPFSTDDLSIGDMVGFSEVVAIDDDGYVVLANPLPDGEWTPKSAEISISTAFRGREDPAVIDISAAVKCIQARGI